MTDETFTRTAPPLNRFEVKLGATHPLPWEVLTAETARFWAVYVGDDVSDVPGFSRTLRAYADAWDAMTKPPALDLSVEAATPEPCSMCDATAKITAAMALLDGIDEIGSALLDDPISDAYNALDDAKGKWTCWGHGEQETA